MSRRPFYQRREAGEYKEEAPRGPKKRKVHTEEDEIRISQIYLAPRDAKFVEFVSSILKLCGLNIRHINYMTNDENIKYFHRAFTHESADDSKDLDQNYEYYEIIGDGIINSLIVKYLFNRFPHLRKASGVKIVAILKTHLVSKKTFSDFSNNLGFWDFISANEYERYHNKKSLLEDAFEGFVGALSIIVSEKIYECAEYSAVYTLLKHILDPIPISTNMEDIKDNITKLKELMDRNQKNPSSPLKDIQYVVFQEGGKGLPSITDIYLTIKGVRTKIARGSASIKKEAEQEAAFNALKYLKDNKYI